MKKLFVFFLLAAVASSTATALYHTDEEVYSEMDGLMSSHEGLIDKISIGKSINGKDISMYIIGTNGSGWSFMFDGRIDGSEDCGTESGMEFIRWVLDNDSPLSNSIKDNARLFFIPIINPDSSDKKQNARTSYIQGGDIALLGDEVIFSIRNGDFKEGGSYWAVRHGYELDSSTSQSGAYSLRSSQTPYIPEEDPTEGDARASWTEQIDVTPGDTIKAGVWIKAEQADCPHGLRFGVDFKSPERTVHVIDGDFVYWANATGEWEYKEFESIVPPKTTHIHLWLQGKPYSCPGIGWFDNISLTVTRSKNTPVPQSVPNGVDLNRNFDHGWGASGSDDPDHCCNYRGIAPASEPETQAVIYAMETFRPDVYMNVQCGSKFLGSETNDSVSKMIFERLDVNFTRMRMKDASEGVGTARSSGHKYGASSWVYRISPVSELPDTIDRYHERFFEETLAVYSAMSYPRGIDPQEKDYSYGVPKTIRNKAKNEVIVSADVSLEEHSHGYIIYSAGNYLLQLTEDNVFQFGVMMGGRWIPLVHSKAAPQRNIPYKIKVVYLDGNAYLFIDGLLEDYAESDSIMDAPAGELFIGNDPEDNRRFKGSIENILIISP